VKQHVYYKVYLIISSCHAHVSCLKLSGRTFITDFWFSNLTQQLMLSSTITLNLFGFLISLLSTLVETSLCLLLILHRQNFDLFLCLTRFSPASLFWLTMETMQADFGLHTVSRLIRVVHCHRISLLRVFFLLSLVKSIVWFLSSITSTKKKYSECINII
jgi:hypothetical protein